MRLPRPMVRLIARGKPLIPKALWPMLNTVASSRGTGPLVADPSPLRTLVLCAHPDDELGCAGTIALLVAGGAEVRVVYATRGDGTRGSPLKAEETGRRRSAESLTSCAALGASDVVFWDFADGTLPSRHDDLVGAVFSAVESWKPERILAPWFLDGHADHQALSRAVVAAALPLSLEIWAYEWWTPLMPNRLVDITPVWSQKEQAASSHVTAALAFDVTAWLGLSRWRSLHGLHGEGYGEAFLVLPFVEYQRLATSYG